MSEYDDDAERLQSMTRNDEINHPQEYHPIQVRQAVVHGREDIVLLVSYLQTANKQLTSIRHLLCGSTQTQATYTAVVLHTAQRRVYC